MKNAISASLAKDAAEQIAQRLDAKGVRIGIVLGTGWGDALRLDDEDSLSFQQLPGFGQLGTLDGHARSIACGTIGTERVAVLRGRVHLNEAPMREEIPRMVRLQIEMLLQLGVRNLILTCAVGALPRRDGLNVGDICVVNDLVTVFAPEMPLYAGEFCSPADTLDVELQEIALQEAGPANGIVARKGAHVMLRGPFFESRSLDKRILADAGALVVGMSVLPEACVAALYPGVNVLALGFVTNSANEEHSHEENMRRAKLAKDRLGAYLERIVARIP